MTDSKYRTFPKKIVAKTNDATYRWFLNGFCPICSCRLACECTFPADDVDPDSNVCSTCEVEWVDG